MATELLRLYAEGSSGAVEFNGNVTLTGNRIDIAGNTVRVNSGGTVNTGANTMVYATDHDYNKTGRGVIQVSGAPLPSNRQKAFQRTA